MMYNAALRSHNLKINKQEKKNRAGCGTSPYDLVALKPPEAPHTIQNFTVAVNCWLELDSQHPTKFGQKKTIRVV